MKGKLAMKSRMTDPRTYLIRMAIILAITAAIIALLWPQLARAFAGNIAEQRYCRDRANWCGLYLSPDIKAGTRSKNG